jgi:hypothetical protein
LYSAPIALWKRKSKQADESAPAAGLLRGDPTDLRPVLAVDVDGVISLFGYEGPIDELAGRFHLIDGMAHCISDAAGPQLMRLGEVYELVWATGWESRANDQLPLILGLRTELPALSFEGRARFGTAHWKLDALDAYAGDRPLAWIDDSLDQSCHTWAAARSAPTLLCPTESHIGLTEAHAEALLAWVRDGYTASSGT